VRASYALTWDRHHDLMSYHYLRHMSPRAVTPRDQVRSQQATVVAPPAREQKLLECSGCATKKPKEDFSTTQMQNYSRKKRRFCRVCVERSNADRRAGGNPQSQSQSKEDDNSVTSEKQNDRVSAKANQPSGPNLNRDCATPVQGVNVTAKSTLSSERSPNNVAVEHDLAHLEDVARSEVGVP